MCDPAVGRLTGKCKRFEEKYQLSSKDFYALFLQGKMGDEEDFFEWKALIEGIREWRRMKRMFNEKKG